MKTFNIGYILIFFILILKCAPDKVLKSKIISKDGLDILYGEITQKQLFFDFPDWEKNYNSYKVNSAILDSLKNPDKLDLEIDIFLGTWCGDSKREVPRFLKIIEQTGLTSKDKVHLYAVDRKKKLENGLAKKNNIQRVATFIIKNDGEEVGRIVEFPKKSIESDLVKILNYL